MMRYFPALVLTPCSALAVLIVCIVEPAPAVFASEPNANTDLVALTGDSGTASALDQKVVCSRNRPLQYSDVAKVASAKPFSGTSLVSNIVQLFCRDVRINTIVVRDYCAVIRE